MQLAGFTFDEIYLRTDSAEFDLHNCFDFTGFSYDISTRSAVLQWHASHYAPQGSPRGLSVHFHAVRHLSVEPRDPDLPFTEDNCLSFVAYANPDAPLGEALHSGNPASGVHLIFCFMSGMRLRIYAERREMNWPLRSRAASIR